ncbi:MAG: hypothetical protein HYY30_04380 [Chloroflexi bacterium]|nr:hypothetical protein [Chloroflexota bacterium]
MDEGIAAGVVQPAERALFENLLLGVVGVEAGGANPFIKRPHNMEGAESSDGLTQLVRQHLWSDENPFDPLTNLRAGLRTLARYYRGYGNRWDLTLVEHLTGDINIHLKTSGGRFIEGSANPAGPSDDRQRRSYQQRVIEINKMARRLLAAGELWDNAYYFVDSASDEVTRGGMALAPPWGIFDSPDLPFDWAPPSTSRAYGLWAGTQADDAYYQKAVAAGIHVRRGNLDNPGVDAPAPFDGDAQVMFEPIEAPTFNPRPPTAQESAVLSGKPHVPAVDLLDYPVERFAQRPAPLPWYETAAIMQ